MAKEDEKEVKGAKVEEKVDKVEQRGFKSKWLEGLTFSFAEKAMVEKNGRKTLQATPKKRPLKEDDVMSWREYPDKVVLATNDGRKYAVKK